MTIDLSALSAPARKTVFVLAIGLAGCVSSSPPEPVAPEPRAERPAPPPPTPYEFGDEDLTINQLPAQNLRPGECGLFLFASQPRARFVFFAEAGAGIGKMKLNGQDVAFVRTSATGQAFDLHFSEQSYQTADAALKVDLSLNPGERSADGTRLEGGSLRLSKSDGWSMVTPVSGASTCGAPG